jgi:hypothetical protein
MLTESFTGIHPSTILFFIGSQVIGLGIAYSIFTRVFEKQS